MSAKKLQAFEYLLFKLLKWQEENGQSVGMTRVKALKLLFLIASVPVGGKDLLDIFDKFYAMPYGPVESDIYDAMVLGRLAHYDFTGTEMKTKVEYAKPKDIDAEAVALIDSSTACMKEKRSDLIQMSAFDLVEYTHTWSCWQDAMFMAQLLSKGSYKMESTDIRNNALEIWE